MLYHSWPQKNQHPGRSVCFLRHNDPNVQQNQRCRAPNCVFKAMVQNPKTAAGAAEPIATDCWHCAIHIYHQKNKMKPTNPNADTYVEEKGNPCHISTGHCCGTPWHDNLQQLITSFHLSGHLSVVPANDGSRKGPFLAFDCAVNGWPVTLSDKTCGVLSAFAFAWWSCSTSSRGPIATLCLLATLVAERHNAPGNTSKFGDFPCWCGTTSRTPSSLLTWPAASALHFLHLRHTAWAFSWPPWPLDFWPHRPLWFFRPLWPTADPRQWHRRGSNRSLAGTAVHNHGDDIPEKFAGMSVELQLRNGGTVPPSWLANYKVLLVY